MSAQLHSNNDQWGFIDFFLLQPSLTYILCMVLCINAIIAVDYARFRVQCHINNAKNETSRSTALRNHSMFIEFREITNKAMKDLGDTCVQLMHSQNIIANGLKEAETTINANVAILSETQTIVLSGLAEADRNIRETVCMQMDLATTQNEIATTQNKMTDMQHGLAITISETKRLQMDMACVQNTFANGLKEMERIVSAHTSRMDAKDAADKSFSNELLDLQEQQHAKITENAMAITEIAARCKGLVEQEMRKWTRAIDMYKYWKTANELYQGQVSIITVIDGMFKQYYNFEFNKKTDYIKDITDATLPPLPATELFTSTRHLGF
jgi:hypothetical protein